MTASKPNILLISSDQQRYSLGGSPGPVFLRIPHYDGLRYEGVTYASAYADCPICVPARTSIMTGKYVFNHGMARNGLTSEVMGREATLPALLRDLGYQTAAIGKMHFGPIRTRHGFDEMIIPDDYYREMRRSGSMFQPMRHGLGQTELYPSMSTVPETLSLTSWIAEKCVEYVWERRDPSLPFFLWCSFTKPHPPLDPPEPYYSMYRDCEMPEPVYGEWSEPNQSPEAFNRFRQRKSVDLIPAEIIREARAAYCGLVTQIDYNMGRVLAAVKNSGLLDNTLIIYLSDHGEYLGDHHAASKVFFHEPSAHVPLVLRMPKTWKRRCHGDRVSTPVTHADILPTLVSAAGGRLPDNVDGQDLVALARGDLENPRRYLEAMAAQYSECEYLAITDGRWKYIWYPEGAAEQLFDLALDPEELVNLAGQSDYDEKRSELKTEMIRRHERRGSRFVTGGELLQRPVKQESLKDRRNQSFWAYHTEYDQTFNRH